MTSNFGKNLEQSSIKYIFENMNYGPPPQPYLENSKLVWYGSGSEPQDLAKAWIADHENKFGVFINGHLETADYLSWYTRLQIKDHLGLHYHVDIGLPTDADIEKGIDATEKAFQNWKMMSFSKRAQCLYSIARNIQKHQSLMAALETMQSERPFYDAKDSGVPCLIRALYHFAGWAQLLENENDMPQPYGVVAVMTIGWASPLTSCWGIAPALATGNAIVLVPDRRCCLSCFLFADICLQAGLPPGTVNVLPGYSEMVMYTGSRTFNEPKYTDTYKKIAKSLTVKKILLSSTPDIAKTLQKEVAGVSNNISVDIGGRPTVVVFDSADIDSAIEGAVETLLFTDCRNYCVRVLAQEPIYKLVVNKLEKRVEKLRVGECFDKNVDISSDIWYKLPPTPMYLHFARDKGARIHPEFDVSPKEKLLPTVVSGVQTSDDLLYEECAGPILIVLPFRNAQEAVALTNNGRFNSSVCIWSERHAVAMEIAYKVKSNIVWINCQNLMDPAISYGSFIHTGISQDGGEWAILNFTTTTHHTPKLVSSDVIKSFGTKPIVSPKFEVATERVDNKSTIDHTHKLYYGGIQKRPEGNSSFSVYNYKNEIIGYAPDAGKKDVRNAVEAAHAALLGWSEKSGHNRAQILYYIAENMQLRSDEFSTRIVKLTGKSLEQSQNEVEEAVQIIFRWAAACDKYKGTVQETAACKTVVTVAEPLGVIGIICYNWKDKSASFPLFSFASLLSAAIATGNTVVIVPGECGQLIALDLYQIFDTSDVPKGVINILTGNQDHLACCLAEHQNIQGIWYHAGSSEGEAFVTHAASENFKYVWIQSEPPSMKFYKNRIKEFTFHATRRKCIWLPSGDAFP